ncbi:MAG: winged helix DNA-binding domain-containing protein [Ilumatobacteraceae bacterium]|nr:winged helix DNA-binding domain-containing protein [Ilumatobacteraceae bacterium]
MARDTLSVAEARRISLAAQGFAEPRPTGRIDRRHLRRALDRMGLIQIDSVNVLVRSQELPLFARLGPHPRTLIPDATDDGELFEYTVHEASHVPTEHHHLHRWAMRTPHRWAGLRRLMEHHPNFVDEVLRFVTDHGPVVAGDLRTREGPKGSWWDWDDGKVALEALFHDGRLTARRRRSDFARVYDLPERCLPAEVLARPTPGEREARAELLVLAARHHGLGTLADLADYHRQKPSVCAPIVAELVEEGRLREVRVEGWTKPAYLHPEARLPRRIEARALLSPFDPVVWFRDRALRLFGFHYRIEIYVPAPKRRYGYYVLPFLLGDELVARVDLKADRARRVLVVQSAWGEPGIDVAEVAAELAGELRLMADWLELDAIEVADRGDLSTPLAARVGAASPTAARG